MTPLHFAKHLSLYKVLTYHYGRIHGVFNHSLPNSVSSNSVWVSKWSSSERFGIYTRFICNSLIKWNALKLQQSSSVDHSALKMGPRYGVEKFGNKRPLTQWYIPPDLVSKLKHLGYSIVGLHGWFAVRVHEKKTLWHSVQRVCSSEKSFCFSIIPFPPNTLFICPSLPRGSNFCSGRTMALAFTTTHE